MMSSAVKTMDRFFYCVVAILMVALLPLTAGASLRSEMVPDEMEKISLNSGATLADTLRQLLELTDRQVYIVGRLDLQSQIYAMEGRPEELLKRLLQDYTYVATDAVDGADPFVVVFTEDDMLLAQKLTPELFEDFSQALLVNRWDQYGEVDDADEIAESDGESPDIPRYVSSYRTMKRTTENTTSSSSYGVSHSTTADSAEGSQNDEKLTVATGENQINVVTTANQTASESEEDDEQDSVADQTATDEDVEDLSVEAEDKLLAKIEYLSNYINSGQAQEFYDHWSKIRDPKYIYDPWAELEHLTRTYKKYQ